MKGTSCAEKELSCASSVVFAPAVHVGRRHRRNHEKGLEAGDRQTILDSFASGGAQSRPVVPEMKFDGETAER